MKEWSSNLIVKHFLPTETMLLLLTVKMMMLIHPRSICLNLKLSMISYKENSKCQQKNSLLSSLRIKVFMLNLKTIDLTITEVPIAEMLDNQLLLRVVSKRNIISVINSKFLRLKIKVLRGKLGLLLEQ